MSVNKKLADHIHKEFLKEGQCFALHFKEGWAVFRVTGVEPSGLYPFVIERQMPSLTNGTFVEANDGRAPRNYFLEPPTPNLAFQIFWGIKPSGARVYYQNPTRRNRWNLLETNRVIGGIVGFVDYEASPYEGPFSPVTEIFTLERMYPAFCIYNAMSYTLWNITMKFLVMKYRYHILTDKNEIKARLTQKKPCKIHTLGGIDPFPRNAPDWFLEAYPEAIFDYTLEVMAEGTEAEEAVKAELAEKRAAAEA